MDELCSSSCACPEPPQPTAQLDELLWDWEASWLVSAEFDADESAELSSFWLALLVPPLTEPPAIETGTLALTPFCVASAVDLAF